MDKSNLIVTFGKPYTFEGETITEIDLSGLEDIRGADMVDVKRISGAGKNSPVPEMAMEYALTMAARVSERPVEFFQNLPGREAIKVKNAVTSFFFSDD